MWKKTSEIKTVTRKELFTALHNSRKSLPDWHEVDCDEGYVTINFYVDEEEGDE